MTATKLSETVLLPKTAFAMRGQLSKQEPGRLKRWLDTKRYAKMREARTNAPTFFLHDGPPYANGHIHIGHALNKILKDVIVRYKFLRGFDAPYLPGWDCHGLPIELKALEAEGADGSAASGLDRKLAVRRACRAYAEKYLDSQREEFLRLGILGEFERPYLTMAPDYQADILEGLANLVESGYVTRSQKPVLWCAQCETALADAEVEYEEASTPSITVKFPVEGEASTFLLIWTTTPWTLPANIAAAVNPDATYLRATVGKEIWIVAESRAASLGVSASSFAETVKGAELTKLSYRHPFLNRIGRVFAADFVTLDTGTGIVHIAPGHGEEDFHLGQKHKLETLSPVDANGRLTAEAGLCAGEHVFDANPKIIDHLRKTKALVKCEEMTHSYPHCWRCKSPVIFRATPQWFVRIDHNGLRQKLLGAIGAVKWFPAAGETRIRGMVESRPDWCISRQRAWGVPIPAFHCASCGYADLDADTVRRVARRVRSESADVWFTERPESFRPSGWSCPACGKTVIKREEDILDVWFDSGMSHVAALERRYRVWPADLYLEGSDQHRGWFQVSLILGSALKSASPYRQVLTHGFVMDGEGRKMSKSIGNVVTPQEIVEQHGADVLRLWVASCDYTSDVRIGPAIVAETVDTYRRIRNTIRFLLGNLIGFDAATADAAAVVDPLDQFILGRLSDLVKTCLEAYDRYDFSTVSRRIRDFCAEELSGFYLDALKDRLYCDGADDRSRRSSQTALAIVAEQILGLISPILPFTAEEAFEAWGRPVDTVACEPFKSWSYGKDERLHQVFDRILETRKAVNMAIESARQAGTLGGSLEASVTVRAPAADWEMLRQQESRLVFYFIVSECRLEKIESGSREIRVSRAAGEKCDRCWKYVPSRTPALNGHVCGRCADVLRGLAVVSSA